MPAWEAVDLCERLLVDMSSHLCASVSGWDYPMGRAEMYAAATLARVINVTRGKDEKPFTPDWPWPAAPKADDVTPEERAVLVAKLRSRSAFGQKRTES